MLLKRCQEKNEIIFKFVNERSIYEFGRGEKVRLHCVDNPLLSASD